MMWRLVFFGLVIWFFLFILKRDRKVSDTPKVPKNKSEIDDDIENMVRCEHCSVHIPRSEAFLVDGHFFCCKSHIKLK